MSFLDFFPFFIIGQSIEFEFFKVIFQLTKILLWVYFLDYNAPKINQNNRSPPKNSSNCKEFSCRLVCRFISIVEYCCETKCNNGHDQMIHDPLIAGNVTIVFLFFRCVKGQNLVYGWFVGSDLVTSFGQHSKKGQNQNEDSVSMF